MKYKDKKLDKKQVILETCEAHPDCSLEEIGDVFGVTRQYVSLLVIENRKVKNVSTMPPEI